MAAFLGETGDRGLDGPLAITEGGSVLDSATEKHEWMLC